jgi:hypothetical protein
MPLAQAEPTSVETFLAWERGLDFRDELDGVQPTATTGATDDWLKLRFQVAGGDPSVVVAGRPGHPDLVATCSTIPPGSDLFSEPPNVFRTRSTSSDLLDCAAKADERGAPSSIGRHLMLAQPAAEATIPSPQSGARARGCASGRDAIIQLTEFLVALPLAEVYRRIVLDD